jgi:hypothetical protein
VLPDQKVLLVFRANKVTQDPLVAQWEPPVLRVRQDHLVARAVPQAFKVLLVVRVLPALRERQAQEYKGQLVPLALLAKQGHAARLALLGKLVLDILGSKAIQDRWDKPGRQARLAYREPKALLGFRVPGLKARRVRRAPLVLAHKA